MHSYFDSLRSRAFVGIAIQAAVASQYGHAQLFNPAASGVLVVMDHLSVDASAAGLFQIATAAGAFATLVGAGANAYVNGAASAAALRTETNVAQLGATIGDMRAAAAETLSWRPTSAIIIPEGYGVVVRTGGVNTYIGATFQWREISA